MRQEGDYDRYDYYMDLWKNGKIGAVDIVYTSKATQQLAGVEVVTSNYKDADIQSKELCSEILDIEVEYVQVV